MIRFVRLAVDEITLDHDDEGLIVPERVVLWLNNENVKNEEDVRIRSRTEVIIDNAARIVISEEFIDIENC